MPALCNHRGAGLAAAAVAVFFAMQIAPSAYAQFGGSCCIPGNEVAGNTCYVGFDSETQCQDFAVAEFGQEDIIYDDESWYRCNVACGQDTQFYRCQNRDEVASGVAGPICAQAQADGVEEGYVYATTCESACMWNNCNTCEFCNYANQYGRPCTKLACEQNSTCIATQLPGQGEEVTVQYDNELITVLNQFSCAPKPDQSLCVDNSAYPSSSSSSAAYTFEACCVKPPNDPSGPGITYVAASDNDTSMLEAVYGSEYVQALNYYLSYPVQCGEVYEPYSRTWTDQMPTRNYFYDTFVNSICRPGTASSSSVPPSSGSSSSNPGDTEVIACCHPQTQTVLVGAGGGGTCQSCTGNSCGAGRVCLPPDIKSGGNISYCGKVANATSCLSDNQCQSNLCRSGSCATCSSDSQCPMRNCDEASGICVRYADGQDCVVNEQCESSFCLRDTPDDVTGVCARRANGQYCKSNDECASRYCQSDNADMLGLAYDGLPVQVVDYGVAEACSMLTASASRNFTNAMPTPRFLTTLADRCSQGLPPSWYGSSSSYSMSSAASEPIYRYPYMSIEPPDIHFAPSSPEPSNDLYCDRRVGPLGLRGEVDNPGDDACYPYSRAEHEGILDYITVFMDDASVFCDEACTELRRLSVCVAEEECSVMDVELCANRGDYALGFPATMAAGFDELTPDPAGNVGLDKYAFFTCYLARQELFGVGCDVLDNYTIDGRPVVPPGCDITSPFGQ